MDSGKTRTKAQITIGIIGLSVSFIILLSFHFSSVMFGLSRFSEGISGMLYEYFAIFFENFRVGYVFLFFFIFSDIAGSIYLIVKEKQNGAVEILVAIITSALACWYLFGGAIAIF